MGYFKFHAACLTFSHHTPFRFSKIRVDPKTGLVHRDDFRFASSDGNHVRFGRAGDCYSAASRCHKGKFQIDLSGTGLRVKRDAEWEPWGSPRIPQRLLSYKKSEDGSFVYGECGGSCGGCEPKGERLYLEPVSCQPTNGESSSSSSAAVLLSSTVSSLLSKYINKVDKSAKLFTYVLYYH